MMRATRSALLLLAAAIPAAARGRPPTERPLTERPYTPSLTCAAVQAIVARRGTVVLATSATAYETVHRDSGACQQEVTSAPAFEPTLDDPTCFAGYRCKQRTNDGSGGDGGGV